MNNIIQTTRPYTKAELEKGIEIDFLSNAKQLVGVQIIEKTNNTAVYQNTTVQIMVDREIYLPQDTPVSLCQSSIEVPPNQRFLKIAGVMKTINKKCYIKVIQPNTDESFIFSFLLR